MRGTKRKRDIFTLSESVAHLFGAGEGVEHLPEEEEGAIGRWGLDQNLHDHTKEIGANPLWIGWIQSAAPSREGITVG